MSGASSCVFVIIPPPTNASPAWSKLSALKSSMQVTWEPLPLKRLSRRPGKRPYVRGNTCDIQLRPTWPRSLPRPPGCALDVESSSRREFSKTYVPTRTTFAGWEYVRPSRTNRTPRASPWSSVSMCSTRAPVSIRSSPVASARAMTVRSVDAFAPWWQTLFWQNPQYVQAPRPSNGSELIAAGAGYGCQPSREAAPATSSPQPVVRIGAIGKPRVRAPANGLPSAPPTPSSHSTRS